MTTPPRTPRSRPPRDGHRVDSLWRRDPRFLHAPSFPEVGRRRERLRAGRDRATDADQLSAGLPEYLRQLPAEVYPHVTEYADALVGGGTEAPFAFGWDLLVDSLDKYVKQPFEGGRTDD